MSEDWVDFLDDLSNVALDYGACLASPLLRWPLWVALVVSLVVKHTFILPRLEQYYKRTHAERAKVQRRRLRDTLNDPVLALDMEEQLLGCRDIQGDRPKMLQAMEEIRELATEPTSGGEDEDLAKANATKGQEKTEAAMAMLWSTIVLSILLFSLGNTLGLYLVATDSYFKSPNVLRDGLFAVPYRYAYSSALSPYSDGDDYCGGFGGLLSCALFCLVHCVHGYKLVRDVSKKQRRSTATKQGVAAAGVKNTELRSTSDLEQPLLAPTFKPEVEM